MTIDRDQFLEDGYLIVREAVPPDQLEAVREAYEVMVDRQRERWTRDRNPGDPPGGVWETSAQPRLNLGAMAELVDEKSVKAVETWLFPNAGPRTGGLASGYVSPVLRARPGLYRRHP